MPDTQSSNTQGSSFSSRSNDYSHGTLEDFNKSLESITKDLYSAASDMPLHASLRKAQNAMKADEKDGVVVQDTLKKGWKEAENKLNHQEQRPMDPNDPGVSKHRKRFTSERRGSG